MTIQDFINQYNGQALDFDGAYGAQCVDLAQYWAQALGTPTFWGNAIDIAEQTHDGAYEWVPNGPDNFPAPGDIVIWEANNSAIGTGPFGHIDICVNANPSSLTTFDQNWVRTEAHIVDHNDYTGVVGWLHPHVLDAPAPTPPIDPVFVPAPEPTPVPAPEPTPEPTPEPEKPAEPVFTNTPVSEDNMPPVVPPVQPVSDPTPQPKVVATGLAGAVTALVLWGLHALGVVVPAEIGAAFTVLIGFLFGYITSNK